MKISVSLPCYNEEDNIIPLVQAIEQQFAENLTSYDYELQFIDNCSTDNTRNILREVCNKNKKVKAILNARNFAKSSGYYGLLETNGDCSISMATDFQDPVELIPRLVHEWEKGYKIVCAIKTSAKESKLMYKIRSFYYSLIKKMSDVEQIEHFTGTGLYDKSFLDVCRELDEPTPSMRGIVAELGYRIQKIEYKQDKRKSGKSKNNFYSLFDIAMRNFTAYTKVGLRIATFGGLFIGVLSAVVGLVYLILKLIYWDAFPAGIAPMLLGIFFIGAVQLFFIGFLGEYVMSINTRMMKRPLVIEEERINFE